jgi:hypothetical protein
VRDADIPLDAGAHRVRDLPTADAQALADGVESIGGPVRIEGNGP